VRHAAVPVLALFLGLAACGCEDSFSPKETFLPKSYLYCIFNYARLEKSIQFALVNRSYDVDGTNPRVNTVDPFVDGAEIRLTIRRVSYEFRKQVSGPSDTTRYGSPFRYYSARNVPLFPLDTVLVAAYLPDKTVLTGWTIIPAAKPVSSQPVYAVGFTTQVNHFTQGNDYVLDWDDGSHDEHLFFPSLTISYVRHDDDTLVWLEKRIPLRYLDQGGQRVAVYPSPATIPHLVFPFAVIDEAMRELSAGDSVTSRYSPRTLSFRVVDCDFALSRYYMSVNGAMDQFSLRLDESTYSNVQGGGGIIGATNTYGIDYEFDPRYVKLFGYSYR